MARRKKQSRMDPGNLLKIFRSKKRPLAVRDLMKILQLSKKEMFRLEQMLGELEEAGRIIELRGGAYGLTESMSQLTGTLDIRRSGVGFVIPEDKRRNDIFISPEDFNDAGHGDRVITAIYPGRRGKNLQGRIVRILRQAVDSLPLRVVKQMKDYVVGMPVDPKHYKQMMVEIPRDTKKPKLGEIILARFTEKVEGNLWNGELVDVFGPEDDTDVQEKLVKQNYSIPTEFTEDVLAEAAKLPMQPSEEDFAERKDYRDMQFVTIDGAQAKDFDDAIYVEEDGSGFTLWTAIADVAHYVPVHSVLDQEARERGNSYYFPKSVEPMFPENLSNGLCSLNPKTPRLVMVVKVRFSKQGLPQSFDLAEGVIESKARLTYAQVNRALLLDDKQEQESIAEVLTMLRRAEKLARILNKNRLERGSLDFDLPEPEIHYNLSGETIDIRPKPRHFGHQIIEEFMISANEAVAEFLTQRDAPCMYRVHESPDPDKLRSLYKVLKKTDLAEHVPAEPTPENLQGLLNTAEGTEMEFLVNRLVLRSMMQAAYSPFNKGHYGLASECYCHFTSPIRRYADLTVHRSVKTVLNAAGPVQPVKKLKELGEHLSVKERTAMEAEREMFKRVAILFLRDKVGEIFTGVVASISDFGFWVELNEVMAEGLVRLSTMSDDYYALLPERQELVGERTGKRFRLGQKITVRLKDVNLSRLEVNLEYLTEKK